MRVECIKLRLYIRVTGNGKASTKTTVMGG